MKNKVFNLDDIKDFTGEDKVLIQEVLEIFLESSRNDLHRLLQSIHAKKGVECITIAHKLCSTYGYFSKSGVKEVMAQIIEIMQFEQNFSNTEYILAHTYPQIKAIDDFVESYLNVLSKVNKPKLMRVI